MVKKRSPSGSSTNCGIMTPARRKAMCTCHTGQAPPYSARWKGIESFGDVARFIDAKEEERNTLRAGSLQCGQLMTGLFEGYPEACSKAIHIVTHRFRFA